MSNALSKLEREDVALERLGLPNGQDFVVAEKGDDGEVKVHVWCWKSREYERTGRLQAFVHYLASHGVHFNRYGKDNSYNKDLMKLYVEVNELQEGVLETIEPETEDSDSVTVRHVVELLRIRLIAEVHKRKHVLTATEQVMKDGSTERKNNQLVVLKMRKGEDWRKAAERVLASKLGIEHGTQDECFEIDEARTECAEELRPFEGDDRLQTLYKIRTVTMHVLDPRHPELAWIGLPAGTDFVTKEGQIGVHKGGKLHVWTWSPCDKEEEDDWEPVFSGTAFEELSHGLHDAEQLIQQTREHPQISALGLNSPLQMALGKIRQCMYKVADIDATIGDVDVHAMVHGEKKEEAEGKDPKSVSGAALAEFISAQFTRRRVGSQLDSTELELLDGMLRVTQDPHAISLSVADEVLHSIRSGCETWGYDLFELKDIAEGRILESIGEYFLVPLCMSAFHGPQEVTKVFMERVAANYSSNPYHNALHAAQVLHSSMWLTRGLGVDELQSQIERAAFAIAAVCHDIKHLGRNNQFCVSSEHPLAVVYNNSRVLENMHAASCWELMQSTGMLQTVRSGDRAALRSQIIEYILATDMSEHFEVVSKFRVKLDSPDFSMSIAQDRMFAARMCIKAGDIGHSALPWDLHERWSICCVQEFYEQGDEERSLGLPVSPLCDRSAVGDVGKSQKGFIEFVCLPLFEVLADQELLGIDAQVPTKSGATVSQQEDDAPAPALRRRISSRRASQLENCPQKIQRHCIAQLRANARRWVEEPEVTRRVTQFLT